MKELEGAADVMMLPDPDDLPRAAVGAAYRLDAVRHPSSPTAGRCRSARAHICRQALDDAGRARLRFRRRPRSRIPSLQAREGRSSASGDAGQPGEPPDVSLLNQGYQYLTEQRYDEMDPILEILRTNLVDLGLPLRSHRSRVRAEPGRVHLPRRHRPGAGRRHGAVPQRHQAGGAAPRLSRHLHVPAQAAQRHVERLAPAPVAERQEEPRQRLRRRTRAAVGDRACTTWRACSRMRAARPPSARRP